jgi:transposase-like protein
MNKPRRVFSESFKRDKVKLYETGQMSVSQLSKLYEISETALYKWINKYRVTPSSERIVVETDSDYLKLVELQGRIEKMERLIGNQQIALEYHKGIIESASAHYKEDIEKKFG